MRGSRGEKEEGGKKICQGTKGKKTELKITRESVSDGNERQKR